MQLTHKLKPLISRYHRHLYWLGLICLGIAFVKPNIILHAQHEKAVPETAITNPNVLKPEEIKKLSALMTANGKPPYKILPLPAPTETQVVKPINSRCNYNGQDYLPGDIVKTHQGWMRCTPTILFNAGENMSGSPAWTAVP